MGSQGQFDIDPRKTGAGAFGLTSEGRFMICDKCCAQVPCCACGPCCFSNQSRVRVSWQLHNTGNERQRCCCEDPAFLANTIEVPFGCPAWMPPGNCSGCSFYNLLNGNGTPNCEVNVIRGPRWQGWGLPAQGATCSTQFTSTVHYGCEPGGGAGYWIVSVGGSATFDEDTGEEGDYCGNLFTLCLPGGCRTASISGILVRNSCVCGNQYDLMQSTTTVDVTLEVLDDGCCRSQDTDGCVNGDSLNDGLCDQEPGI